MTYEQTLDYLFVRHASVYKGLKRIRYVLDKLDNPQETFPSVLITGTNGKGSTAKMLSSVLADAGYRAGCFTSPHLIDFRERIMIGGEYISKDEVVELTEIIKTGPLEQLEQERKKVQIEGIVSFFEIVTAMGFLHFARHKVDIAILEVGIGGRLDATNTVNPLVSVITNVGLDHQQFLGYTVEEIAREKAAIIHEHGDAVISCQKTEVIEIIEEECRRKHATLHKTGLQQNTETQQTLTAIPQSIHPTGSEFSYQGFSSRLDGLKLCLTGIHQLANATAALTTIELLKTKGFHIPEEAIRSGLSHVSHPGRLELIHTHPRVVVDIAHNSMGSSALANALTTIFDYDKLIVIIGVLHDKDVRGIVYPFLEAADSMIFTSPHNTQRAEAASATEQIAKELVVSHNFHYAHWLIREFVEDAIQQACSIAGERDLICVTGSNYTVSEAELYFSEKK